MLLLFVTIRADIFDQSLLALVGIAQFQHFQQNAEGHAWNFASTRQSCPVSDCQERRGQQALLSVDSAARVDVYGQDLPQECMHAHCSQNLVVLTVLFLTGHHHGA